jgi:hypothetical protein
VGILFIVRWVLKKIIDTVSHLPIPGQTHKPYYVTPKIIPQKKIMYKKPTKQETQKERIQKPKNEELKKQAKIFQALITELAAIKNKIHNCTNIINTNYRKIDQKKDILFNYSTNHNREITTTHIIPQIEAIFELFKKRIETINRFSTAIPMNRFLEENKGWHNQKFAELYGRLKHIKTLYEKKDSELTKEERNYLTNPALSKYMIMALARLIKILEPFLDQQDKQIRTEIIKCLKIINKTRYKNTAMAISDNSRIN